MTASHPDPPDLEPRDRANVDADRWISTVSVRELAELARWALIAAGASAGEAKLAARIVQTAEVEAGCGLSGLLAELDRHRFSPAPVCTSEGAVVTVAGPAAGARRNDVRVTVIDNSEQRGLLVLGPLAAAVVAVRGEVGPPVFLPSIEPHPIVRFVLSDTLASVPTCSRPVVAAWRGAAGQWHVDEVELPHQLNFEPIDDQLAEYGITKGDGAKGHGAGLLIACGVADPAAESFDGNLAAERWKSARRNGVETDAAQLRRVKRYAARFLVDDVTN